MDWKIGRNTGRRVSGSEMSEVGVEAMEVEDVECMLREFPS